MPEYLEASVFNLTPHIKLHWILKLSSLCSYCEKKCGTSILCLTTGVYSVFLYNLYSHFLHLSCHLALKNPVMPY